MAHAGGERVDLVGADVDAAGEARAAPADRRQLVARREAKIAPKIATPSEPPIERKNVAVEVATPTSRAGASFWTASTSTCITRPMPMPTTDM